MQEKSYLEVLVQKYQHIINTLGKQVDDAKNKLTIAQSALQLLQEEDITEQKVLFEVPPEKVSDKYIHSSLRDAIRDILKSHEDYLSGEEIYEELIKNGFTSESKDINRDVYTTLNYLKKKEGERVICIEERRPKVYTIKKEK